MCIIKHFQLGDYFKIRSKWNGKYIGVNSERNLFLTEEDIIWEWNGNTLVNKKNQKVLDIASGYTSNGKTHLYYFLRVILGYYLQLNCRGQSCDLDI